MQWLGIKSNDLVHCHDSLTGQESDSNASGWRTAMGESSSFLTARDRKRAANMIKGMSEDGTESDTECRRELQVMLFLGVKAEIQAVDDTGDMSKWLDEHMHN